MLRPVRDASFVMHTHTLFICLLSLLHNFHTQFAGLIVAFVDFAAAVVVLLPSFFFGNFFQICSREKNLLKATTQPFLILLLPRFLLSFVCLSLFVAFLSPSCTICVCLHALAACVCATYYVIKSSHCSNNYGLKIRIVNKE